jgi:uncharacterized membrane protein YdjX (TVP38/TMEM64 family)
MEGGMQSAGKDKKAIIKASILVAFVIGALVVVRFTSVKGLLTADQLGSLLETAGFWAPLVFMVIYAVGICLFVPGTLLGAIGAVLFGAYLGFVYVWVGAMAGASFVYLK